MANPNTANPNSVIILKVTTPALPDNKALEAFLSRMGAVDYTIRQSGLDYEVMSMSVARLMRVLTSTKSPACGMGFFITDERLKKFKFSAPYYGRQNLVIAAHKDHVILQENFDTLDDLMKSPYRIALNTIASYGADIDLAIDQYKPRIYAVSSKYEALKALVSPRREVDYFIIEEEEIDHLIEYDRRFLKLDYLSLKGLGTTPTRHFMCNQLTPDWIVDKLSAASPYKP